MYAEKEKIIWSIRSILEKIYVCIERYGKLARFSPKLFRSSPPSFLPAVTAKKGTVFDRWRFGWGGKGGGCLRGSKEEEEAGEMDKKSDAVRENCLFKLLFLWQSLEIIVWKTKAGGFFYLRTADSWIFYHARKIYVACL